MVSFKSLLLPRHEVDVSLAESVNTALYRAFRKPFIRSLIPPYTRGSHDTVFGIRVYGHPAYAERWFKLTVRAFHTFLKHVDHVYYWLHYRTAGRYHIVKTGLAPGWHDIDSLMFAACFALLGRYVERELRPASVDDEHMYRGYRIHSAEGTDEKAIDLWLWYRYELPKQIEAYDDDLVACYGLDCDFQTEDAGDGFRRVLVKARRESAYPFDYPEIIKTEKLDELMSIRASLWT